MDFPINRIENSYYKAVPAEEVVEVAKELKKNLITGYEPFAEEEVPFHNLGEDEVLADQLYSSYRMLENVQKTMALSHATYFYALFYGTYYALSSKLEFSKGYRFRSDISQKLYTQQYYNYDMGLLGDGFLYCDDTFTWCIFQTANVRILRGNEVFIQNYFESEERKIDEVETLINDIYDPDLVEAPPRILRYLRYKKNGQWVYPEYKE
jgi:hypothetical protein